MKALVLAGGEPKNLKTLVPPGRSKHTLRILGKPVIAYPIEALSKTLKRDIVLVYSNFDVVEEAKQYAKDRIIPVEQEKPGIEGAILSAEQYLRDTEHFLLMYGDLIIDQKAILTLLEKFYEEEPLAAILTIPLEERFASTYGVAVVNIEGCIEHVLEKPKIEEVRKLTAYTLGGVYILPTWAYDLIEKYRSLSNALNELIKKGKVVSVHWSGLWIDIGYPSDLIAASTQLLQKLDKTVIEDKAVIENNVVIKPPVYIDEGAYIDHYAVLKGPLYVGKNSFIGAHSFVRDCSDIEQNVRIGAYSEVKHSIIQPYTLIDSFAYIADSIIGENTSIGSHIVTLNVLPQDEIPPRLREYLVTPSEKRKEWKLGAIIGYNVKISAGRVLNPGQIIPPNTVY